MKTVTFNFPRLMRVDSGSRIDLKPLSPDVFTGLSVLERRGATFKTVGTVTEAQKAADGGLTLTGTVEDGASEPSLSVWIGQRAACREALHKGGERP